MRIIGGKAAGRIIQVPVGLRLRPTTDKAKEALFNSLLSQIDLNEANVLELFAGTGSLGIEAWSRGARVQMVENNAKQCRFIAETLIKLNAEAEIQLSRMDARSYVGKCSARFDLIIADPPYDMPAQQQFINELLSSEILATEGILVWEHRTGLSFVHPYFQKSKTYGESTFSFFVKNEEK